MSNQITENQNIETEVKAEAEANTEAEVKAGTEANTEAEVKTETAVTGEEVKAEAEAAEEADEKEENSAEKDKKKGKKKRKKGMILKILLALMCVALVCLGVFVYRLTTADARFLRDMNRGLTASWTLENGEIELQNRDDVHSTEFIGLEYDAVSKYRDSKFRNKDLQALAVEYIDSLEQCKSVAESKDPDKDFDGFWREFSQPYGARLTAVYEIYKGGYGLLPENEGGIKEKENLLAQGWILSKAGEIVFERQENQEGIITYTAEIQNDSGFDLEFLDFEVELYNGKGKLIETASAYAENIGKGEPVSLVFYQTSADTVTQYRIISEICRVKSADSQEGEEGTGTTGTEEENGTGTGEEETETGAEEKTGND